MGGGRSPRTGVARGEAAAELVRVAQRTATWTKEEEGMSPTHPVIRALDRAECERILARNHVGRLAYAWQNHVDIEPLNYVFHDGWIYGRTSHGAKPDAVGHTWGPGAFEVDEVEEVCRWRGVVVHGGFYTLPAEGSEWQAEEWRQGVELLRRIIP